MIVYLFSGYFSYLLLCLFTVLCWYEFFTFFFFSLIDFLNPWIVFHKFWTVLCCSLFKYYFLPFFVALFLKLWLDICWIPLWPSCIFSASADSFLLVLLDIALLLACFCYELPFFLGELFVEILEARMNVYSFRKDLLLLPKGHHLSEGSLCWIHGYRSFFFFLSVQLMWNRIACVCQWEFKDLSPICFTLYPGIVSQPHWDYSEGRVHLFLGHLCPLRV